MKTFTRVAFALLVLVGIEASAPAQAATTDEAGKYVTSLADQALAIISNKAANKDQKQAGFDKLFADNVDFPWVGRFVMGRYWRQATDDQKTRYLVQYQKFLTLHYTNRFTEYTSGKFKVNSSREDGDNEFTVSMEIQSDEPNSQPIMVDYRIRKEDQGFKVFDVIVEGVSLITTQRSEFASVIGSNGIDYLISQLETRSKTGDVEMGAAKADRS